MAVDCYSLKRVHAEQCIPSALFHLAFNFVATIATNNMFHQLLGTANAKYYSV